MEKIVFFCEGGVKWIEREKLARCEAVRVMLRGGNLFCMAKMRRNLTKNDAYITTMSS